MSKKGGRSKGVKRWLKRAKHLQREGKLAKAQQAQAQATQQAQVNP